MTDTVTVRVVDLYEAVWFFYASDEQRTAKQQEAVDRLSIAMYGVPTLDQIIRQFKEGAA